MSNRKLPAGCNLINLAYLLRHQELWPEGFVWNYGDSDRCALALIRRLWYNGEYIAPQELAGNLGMSEREAEYLFFALSGPENKGQLTVTPDFMADAVISYLVGGAEALIQFTCYRRVRSPRRRLGRV